jgi:hypothetical protein
MLYISSGSSNVNVHPQCPSIIDSRFEIRKGHRLRGAVKTVDIEAVRTRTSGERGLAKRSYEFAKLSFDEIDTVAEPVIVVDLALRLLE